MQHDLEAVGKCADEGTERRTEQLSSSRKVLSGTMDEKVSCFGVECPPKRWTLLRLGSGKGFRETHLLAKMFQWVYSKCNNPNDDACAALISSSPRVKGGGLIQSVSLECYL